MRALDLELATKRRPSHWAGWVLLGVGLLFASDLARSYLSSGERITEAERRILAVDSVAPKPVHQASGPEELAEARAVVARFATPWPALFDAIESVQVDDISLLSIEPDSATRSVTISGEARNYLAVLTYVARLAEQPGLARVYLARHEVRETEPRRPVAFAVSAQWSRR